MAPPALSPAGLAMWSLGCPPCTVHIQTCATRWLIAYALIAAVLRYGIAEADRVLAVHSVFGSGRLDSGCSYGCAHADWQWDLYQPIGATLGMHAPRWHIFAQLWKCAGWVAVGYAVGSASAKLTDIGASVGKATKPCGVHVGKAVATPCEAQLPGSGVSVNESIAEH